MLEALALRALGAEEAAALDGRGGAAGQLLGDDDVHGLVRALARPGEDDRADAAHRNGDDRAHADVHHRAALLFVVDEAPYVVVDARRELWLPAPPRPVPGGAAG